MVSILYNSTSNVNDISKAIINHFSSVDVTSAQFQDTFLFRIDITLENGFEESYTSIPSKVRRLIKPAIYLWICLVCERDGPEEV
jgi:phosphatidylinositol kinase/protein kinase (PI-3  family)